MATSLTQHEANVNRHPGNGRDLNYYLPLYKAAMEGDWKSAESFFEHDRDAVTARITKFGETALHVAALAGHSRFVEELLELMPLEAIALQDGSPVGRTALHSAAIAGNTKAAKAIVEKDSNLTQIPGRDGVTPVLNSSNFCSPGQKETLSYLCTVTRDEHPSPFRGPLAVLLILNMTNAGFYDICLYLVKRYPHLATLSNEYGTCMLNSMAQWPNKFPSGIRLGFFQRRIYSFIPVEREDASGHAIREGTENPNHFKQAFKWLSGLLFKAIKQAPGIKELQETKLAHIQARELLECLLGEISRMENSKIYKFFEKSNTLSMAAKYGTTEILIECIRSFPDILWIKSHGGRTIFHIAVENRREEIFNIICGLNGAKNILNIFYVQGANNILHLAAKLAPYRQLNSISGAALQMQRELQWYKEVEKMVEPIFREVQNQDGNSPPVIFTEAHANLLEKGEKWMKDTAQSCMVVATLITTVVFAAAFTVPGGNISDTDNSENGTPIFLHRSSFMLFVISDVLALFSSATSVLMFLSILTARYAEEDFLTSLPKKLIIGLATLFFSIATMMIAFCAALSIVLGQKLAWVSIIVAIFGCVPVTLFALLQLPLFVQIVRSTYGSSIFQGKPKLF